jgi:hypothetical protein
MANATRFHFDPNFTGAGLGNLTLNQFQIATSSADLRRLHFCTHSVAPSFSSISTRAFQTIMLPE